MKTILVKIFNRMYRKRKIKEENFLLGETIRRAAQLISQKGTQVPPMDQESTPLETLGILIGLLRRRKHISHLQFAQNIGCSMEELLALEAGLLPAPDFVKYLPLILREINIPKDILQSLIHDIEFT